MPVFITCCKFTAVIEHFHFWVNLIKYFQQLFSLCGIPMWVRYKHVIFKFLCGSIQYPWSHITLADKFGCWTVQNRCYNFITCPLQFAIFCFPIFSDPETIISFFLFSISLNLYYIFITFTSSCHIFWCQISLGKWWIRIWQKDANLHCFRQLFQCRKGNC